jgi:hypothetical protein
MRATPLLLGCLLGLSTIATTAMATGSSIAGTLSSSAASSYHCNHQLPEHSSNHDMAPSGGGDALGVSHAGAASASSSNHQSSSASSSSESDVTHFGDDASPNHSSHGSGLSWQSLLPGSIQ